MSQSSTLTIKPRGLSFSNDISIFIQNPFLQKSNSGPTLLLAEGMWRFYTFSKIINQKVNEIGWLELEVAYFEAAI